MSRASGSSLNFSCVKPIENVCTGRLEASAIAATTAAESTPPERKAPSGTSEISRRAVAARMCSRSSSCDLARIADGRACARSRAASSARSSRAVLEHEGARRRQLADRAEGGHRRGHPAVGEEASSARVVDLARNRVVCHERRRARRRSESVPPRSA
jgi:hypothetical protein